MRTVQSAHERRPYRDFDSANRYPDRFRARTLKAEQAMRNRNSTLMRNAAHSGAALLTSSPNAGLLRPSWRENRGYPKLPSFLQPN
jgi:hypothetical protein